MMKNIKFDLPKHLHEIIGILLTLLSGGLMFILATKLLILGVDYSPHVWASFTIKAINLFWVTLAIYHVGLMFLITRSVMTGRTHYIIDAVVGFFGTLGLFFIVGSTIAGIYFGHANVEWFFNIPQMGLFAVGFIIEVITLLYFAFTE